MNLMRRRFRDPVILRGKGDFAAVSKSQTSGLSNLGEPLKWPMPLLRDSSLRGRLLGSTGQGTAGGL